MRAEGLRVGFYYSLLDWHHPDYTVDLLPSDARRPGIRGEGQGPRLNKYADYLFDQVRELLTDFGKIDVLFLDYSFPGPDGKGRNDWRSEKLLKMIRGTPAGDHRQRPPGPPRRPGRLGLPDPRTVHAKGMGQGRRPAGPMGDVSDVLRLLGLLSGRIDLEIRPAARRHADRDGQQGRQPHSQRRADGPRDSRPDGPSTASRASASG